jgi:hypothetical protein
MPFKNRCITRNDVLNLDDRSEYGAWVGKSESRYTPECPVMVDSRVNRGISLLNVGDDASFHESGRRFLRWMQPVVVGVAGKSAAAAKSVGVVTEIESQIGSAPRSGARWSRLFCIEVRENDGMSWTAESVRIALAKRFPAFKLIAVRNEAATDRMPVIADILGRNLFMRRAVKLGLADEYPTFHSWRSVLLLALAVGLIFAKSLADVLLKAVTNTTNSGPMTAILLLVLAAAAATVIGQWLLVNKPVLSRRRSEEGFRQKLSALPAKSEYPGFVEELARELGTTDDPRIVIIDNYDAVDEMTQSVIARYIGEIHAEAKQSELWVVFEGETGDRLSAQALETWSDPRALRPLLYRQQFLSPDERRSLAKKAGDESRATFSAVKSICRRGQAEDEWICNLLTPLASKYESPLALPYFFLLAMEVPDLHGDHRQSALGANVFHSWLWLESLTTEKAGIRAAVLAAFMGKALTKSDVNSVERTIREQLEPLIVEANDRTFAVTREAALHLFDHAGEHQLKGAAIAKLFWAFALAQKKPVTKAFWTRRVIHHLLEVEISALPPELTRGVVLTELRNLALSMIDNAIRCCLFGELPELIQFTRLLIADYAEYDPNAVASVKRLRRRALEAYHLTGSEEILREIVQSYELPEDAPAVRADLHPMLRLYAESISLIPDLRAVLEAYILGDQGRTEIPDAYDHALARGCWLALLGAPFFGQASRNPKAFGSFDVSDVRATIDGIVDRVMGRLSRGEDEDISTLDVSTLSFAIWCRALMLDAQVLEFLPADAEALPVLWTSADADEIPGFIRRTITAAREFGELVRLASNAVVVASLFLGNARRGGAPHFLATALVNETCAMALASVWLGHALVAAGQIAVADVEGELKVLLKDVDGVLGTSLADAAKDAPFAAASLRSSVHDLVRIATVVWRHFTLPTTGDLTALRSVHFGFVADAIGPDDDERQRPLLAEIEPLITEQHFTGLAANLTLALCYRASNELSAIHLSQAAHVAMGTLFGDGLKVTLALITVLNSSGESAEWDALVKAVLHGDGGPSAVARFLAETADEQLRGAALKLMNAARNAADRTLHEPMAAALRERLASVADPTRRDEIESMLELFDVQRELREGKMPPAAVLERWRDRKQFWTYARVLLDLRRAGYGDAGLRAEALQLLERDPRLDSINSWYHLALDLARETDGDDNSAIEYVRNVVARFESVEAAETNIRAYGLLMVRSPDDPDYTSGLVRAQRIKIKRDYNQRLPGLIEQGKFFLIFTDHVEHMQIWGLPLDVPPQQFYELMRQQPEQRREWIRQWDAAGRRIPQPIVVSKAGIAVCSDFVVLGTYLFGDVLEQDETFAPVRRALNEAAYAAMPSLLNEIGSLSRTPPEIRNLLRHYAASSTAES